MKITGIFLVFLILSLNMLPCCGDNCKEENSIEHSAESSSSDDLCSPFFQCGGCSGLFYSEKILDFNFQKPEIEKEMPGLIENNYSGYISYIWQPPQN